MRVSIAMCTYNGAVYLNEQMQSFVAQERLPDELVVCDDGSTDDSIALVERFAATAPFSVRVVQNPHNLGYSRNFAQALELCTGDLIALSDQDDIWYPEKLRVLENLMVANPEAEGVFSDGDILDEESRPVGRTLWNSFRFFPDAQQRFSTGGSVHELLRRNVVTGMALLIRRSTRESLRDAPESWIHDGWLAFMIALKGGLLACPKRLVGYRVHGMQQVGTPPTSATKMRAVQVDGLHQYAARVLARNLDEYRRTDQQYADLLVYLKARGLGSGPVQMAVQAKQQHAARGAQHLTRSRLRRVALLRYAGSYSRFSPNGLRGLLRDLLL